MKHLASPSTLLSNQPSNPTFRQPPTFALHRPAAALARKSRTDFRRVEEKVLQFLDQRANGRPCRLLQRFV